MSTTWLLIADRRRAHLFEVNAASQSICEIEAFENSAGSATPRATAANGATPIGDPDAPLSRASVEFAGALCDILGQARQAGRFERLIAIAPPEFAQELEMQLDDSVRDCAHVPEIELAAEIAGVLRPLS